MEQPEITGAAALNESRVKLAVGGSKCELFINGSCRLVGTRGDLDQVGHFVRPVKTHTGFYWRGLHRFLFLCCGSSRAVPFVARDRPRQERTRKTRFYGIGAHAPLSRDRGAQFPHFHYEIARCRLYRITIVGLRYGRERPASPLK